MFARLNLRHNLRHAKTFFKKIHSRGKPSKHYTSRVLQIPFSSPESPIFGTKHLPCRRFLQHYYRNALYRATESQEMFPEISLFCSMLALIPQSGDFSGATLGVRSVALLQVAKLAELLTKVYSPFLCCFKV